MRLEWVWVWCSCCVWVTSAACEDGGPVDLPAGADAGEGAGRDGGAADAGFDLARDPACSAGSPWLVVLRGRVVDEASVGLEGVKVQLCLRLAGGGRLVCLSPATTEAGGAFGIHVPPEGRCLERAALRVVWPRTDHASTYCGVALPAGEPVLALPEPLRLFATARAPQIPPVGDPAVVRTVDFGGGLSLELAPARFFATGDGYAALAGRRVGLDSPGLCFLEAGRPMVDLYAFSPEGAVEGGFGLHLPAPAGLGPGRRVALSALGGLGCTLGDGTPIPEAEWREFATATVGASGSIEVPAVGGLPCVNWLGVSER